MYYLTEEDIKELNCSEAFDSWYQGIYKEGFGVPDDVKDVCIYKRWSKGGVRGGSCWDSSNPKPYEGDEEPDFVVLDKVLMKIAPNLSFLHYKEVERLIVSSYETEYHYYGNRDEWEVAFIPLPVLYKKLESLGY